MALLRSVRKPPFSRTMVPPSLLCSHLTPPASGVLHSAAPRAVHSCPLSLSGKGNSRPHYWVSTMSLVNSLESPLPRARLHQPLLLLGLLLPTPCPGAFRSSVVVARPQALATWGFSGDSRSLAGAYRAWHSGAYVPVPGAHRALVLPPPHPAPLRLEPRLEPNRAPTLSFLGHVPIGCPWGNRVTRDVC